MSKEENPDVGTLQTERGPLYFRRGSRDKLRDSERWLTPSETSWLIERSAGLPTFIEHHGLNPDVFDPREMDRLFAAWLIDDDPEKIEPQEVATLLGIAFGNHLRRALAMEWIEMTDDFGTTIALRSTFAPVYVWPFEAVRKRIDRGETEFFYAIEQLATHDLLRRLAESEQVE